MWTSRTGFAGMIAATSLLGGVFLMPHASCLTHLDRVAGSLEQIARNLEHLEVPQGATMAKVCEVAQDAMLTVCNPVDELERDSDAACGFCDATLMIGWHARFREFIVRVREVLKGPCESFRDVEASCRSLSSSVLPLATPRTSATSLHQAENE
jgi:hypothetical protein